MDEIRRKAEELFRTVVKDANNRQVPKERLIGKLETALRQARLEENLEFRIEEKHGGEGRVWYSLQKRGWTAHSIWDTREEAEAAIAIAKRRGEE